MIQSSVLRLHVDKYRAVNSAKLKIGDITVLSGVNASGKSTLAHLLHSLINLSRAYRMLACEYAWRPVARIVFYLSNFGSNMADISDSEEDSPGEEMRFSHRKAAFSQDLPSRKAAFLEMLDMAFHEYHMALDSDADEARRQFLSFVDDIGYRTESTPKENEIRCWCEKAIREAEGKYAELMKSRSPEVWQMGPRDAVRWLQYGGSVQLYEGGNCVYSSGNNAEELKEILGIDHAFYIESPWRTQPGLDPITGEISIGDGFDFAGADESFIPDDDLFAALEGRIDERKETFVGMRLGRRATFRRGRWVYARADGHEPFPLEECATGIKALSVLDFLYTKGCLGRKTLLVIDEPEAHLHPQWILEYAKILVRLNRRLGVRLLITTHSPDMLNAIRRVGNVEEVPDLRFYLAEEVSPEAKYDFNYNDLGRNVEPIFAKFNLAADRTEAYPEDH